MKKTANNLGAAPVVFGPANLTTLACRILVLALLCFASLQTSRGAIDFVQLTDPHLFEDTSKPERVGQDTNNRIAFAACISQINILNEQLQKTKNAKFSFVVVTGDLGIESVDTNNWGPDVKIAADIIGKSDINVWLFVPGNNDLVDETPASIWKYHEFIKRLSTHTDLRGFTVTNLCPPDAANTNASISIDYPINGYHFLGFNNASFKSNYKGRDAQNFHAAQRTNIDQISGMLGNKLTYIFYHIPEIDDPFPLSRSALEKRRYQKGIAGDPKIYSAWTVSNDLRIEWDKVVANGNVKALIAGHFHSDNRDVYRNFDWMQDQDYKSVILDKLWVCPPIACKFQTNSEMQARGFRTYSINTNDKLTSEIIWYGFQKDKDIPDWVKKGVATGTPQPMSINIDNGNKMPPGGDKHSDNPHHKCGDCHKSVTSDCHTCCFDWKHCKCLVLVIVVFVAAAVIFTCGRCYERKCRARDKKITSPQIESTNKWKND